jgi:hypothetical protein
VQWEPPDTFPLAVLVYMGWDVHRGGKFDGVVLVESKREEEVDHGSD